MQDRIPVNPGRVLITPENGSAAYYATMTRADNPTQNGTPLNKASLLKDATAALFGLGADAVPDDVLAAIKALIDDANNNADARAKIATGSYKGTGTFGASNKNSLTFDFKPKTLILWNNDTNAKTKAPMCFVAPNTTQPVAVGTAGGYDMVLTWGETSVQWYMSNSNGKADAQFNSTYGTNYYIAIG